MAVKTIVRVQVLVEIDVEGFGGSWTFEEIEKRVPKEASAKILRAIQNIGGSVIGPQKMKLIVVEKDL